MKKIPGLMLGLFLLGGIAGLLRLAQTTRHFSGATLRFSQQHSVQWDPATRLIRRAGDDPYVFLDLPASAVPVRGVTVEFGGPLADGPTKFYVYQSSAYVPGVALDDSHLVLGHVQPAVGGFSIQWRLADSKIVRLDLPDDLAAPVEIRRVTVVSGFNGHWLGSLSWMLLLAGALVPLGAWLPGALHHRAWLEPAIVLVLVILKLVLASDLRLAILADARHDDLLFLSQAESLMRGQWLGPFNELTLAKGPVYPLFLAGVGLAGMPLLLTQALVHAAACIVFVRAIRPLVPGATVRLLLFSVLLFDPHTLSSATVGRVLRSGLQPALTLLVLAGAIGLAARALRPLRVQLAWSVLAGAAFALFWFSREEGLWLLPSVALIFLSSLVIILRAGTAGRRPRLLMLALPVVLFVGAFALLRGINECWYHAPLTVDVRDGAFPRAYGALLRLTPEHPSPRVPMDRATRARAYAVSPAFAELRPFLEGAVGARWAQVSQGAEPDGAPAGEIQGGWFQWALREAAAQAGHYRDAATADAFWARVAHELNAAADARVLPAGPPRSGFFPRWDATRWAPARCALFGAAGVVARWTDFAVQFPPQPSSESQRARFTRVTHENVATALAPLTPLTSARLVLADAYRWVGTLASLPAVLSAAYLAVRAARRLAGALKAAILLALVGGALALMLVCALVDATSFSAVHAMYLAPATPLVLALWVLAPVWAVQTIDPRLHMNVERQDVGIPPDL